MILLVYLFSLLIRVAIGLWGYSGAGKPPMYGDFEAQRHWLEITINTPIGEWYKNTSDNDLLYWGLDYPPLTAYVSYFFGMVAKLISPPLVQLYSSRGHESDFGKFFMRATVLLCDVIILFPFVKNLIYLLYKPKKSIYLNILISLLSPSLLLIDHGHFQYNSVCIGLALAAIYYIVNGQHLLGSFFFCMSLNFKQMSLYYAPVFFFILLRKCFDHAKRHGVLHGLVKLASISTVVFFSFFALWFPFCYFPSPQDTCLSSSLQVEKIY